MLPESLDRENRRRFDWARANALGAFRHFAKIPYLAWFLVALGLFNFAHWVYPSTFSWFGAVRYGWDEGMIGWALAAVGVGSAIVQGGLVGRWIKRFGATRTVIFGFIVCIVTFGAYALATEGWMVFVIIPFGALGGLLGPALNQIMTSRVPRNAQGELQGAIASVQALANVFAPVAMTQTFFYFTHSAAPFYFPGAAFALAAVVCTISMIPLIRGLRTVPKIAGQPDDPRDEGVPDETAAADARAAPQSA